MDCKNNRCLDSEASEASTEQNSQESLIIIPDTEDSRNSFYSNDADDHNNEPGRIVDYCKILPNLKNCKSTETSFLDYDIHEDVSPYSSTLSKSLSETLYFCNKIVEPYQQPFTVRAENLNDRSLENNVILADNYSDFTFPSRNGNRNWDSMTLRLCSNSNQNIKESPGSNYHSTCITDQTEVGSTCLDKTKTEVCEGKSNDYAPKPCKIKDNSAINFKCKRSCTKLPKIQSKSSINSAQAQDSKKIEERFSCLPASAHKCCPARLRMPQCKDPPPKKPEKSCCSILETFKSSYTNIHKCSPSYTTRPQSSSSNENETRTPPPIRKEEPVSPEKILSCISTTEETKKTCKNKPSYCANTVIIKSSETIDRTHLSFLKLNKFPSKIKAEDIQYEPAEALNADESLSGTNLFTDSQRNFNAYYEFNHSSKPRNLSNCMKVKVIPSTTDLTQSAMSVTMMKVDLNETIPTCKITSEDFTTIAKDFFGNIYTRTKDAMTTITRESARHLQAIIHKTQSCNTDGTLPPLKVYKDVSVDTPPSYVLDYRNCPLKMVDKGTGKADKPKRGKKIAIQSSNSTVNFCSCSKKYRAPLYTTVATQEPPQQPNSVFTAIKSKIFSIFREDDNVHSAYKMTHSESSDSMSDEYEDSEASLKTLQKQN